MDAMIQRLREAGYEAEECYDPGDMSVGIYPCGWVSLDGNTDLDESRMYLLPWKPREWRLYIHDDEGNDWFEPIKERPDWLTFVNGVKKAEAKIKGRMELAKVRRSKTLYQQEAWNTIKAFLDPVKYEDTLEPGQKGPHSWLRGGFKRPFHSLHKDGTARIKICGIYLDMRHRVVQVGVMLDWLDDHGIPYKNAGSGFYSGLEVKIPPQKE